MWDRFVLACGRLPPRSRRIDPARPPNLSWHPNRKRLNVALRFVRKQIAFRQGWKLVDQRWCGRANQLVFST